MIPAVQKAAKAAPTPKENGTATSENIPRPRLQKLSVKNFRAIGSTAVEIALDDIVVLVGPNKCG